MSKVLIYRVFVDDGYKPGGSTTWLSYTFTYKCQTDESILYLWNDGHKTGGSTAWLSYTTM